MTSGIGEQGSGCRVQGTGGRGQGSGISLIEAMLTVAILSIGLAGVIRGYAVSLETLKAGRDAMNTVYLLKEKMDGVEQERIEKGRLSRGTETGEFSGRYGGFRWKSVIEPLTIKEGCVLEKISLMVEKKRSSSVKGYTFLTYLQDEDEK